MAVECVLKDVKAGDFVRVLVRSSRYEDDGRMYWALGRVRRVYKYQFNVAVIGSSWFWQGYDDLRFRFDGCLMGDSKGVRRCFYLTNEESCYTERWIVEGLLNRIEEAKRELVKLDRKACEVGICHFNKYEIPGGVR